MNLRDALKVVDLIDKYTGAEGQDFPTEKAIMESLFTLRDALEASGCIVDDGKGRLRATAAAERAAQNARSELPTDQVDLARRLRELPSDVQMGVNAQLRDCGVFLKPVLTDRPKKDAHDVFNGLLEAMVSVAEIGVKGRRDPRIVVPGERTH